MSMNRFLQMKGRLLLIGALLCTVLVMTENSVLAHGGEDITETSPSHSIPSSPSTVAKPAPIGLQAACLAMTIPYGAAKIAYAISGGIVGGLAWVTTGGNTEVAQSIWIPSMTGDYIVQPQHLTREKRLHFVGPSSADPS